MKYSCMHRYTVVMPRDVPPLDGMRDTNLMAKLCSSSGEGMFGWCQDEILDLALSSSTEGRYRERSLHTKRTVWEPTGTEWAELACLRELCLSYGVSEVSPFVCLDCAFCSCRRWGKYWYGRGGKCSEMAEMNRKFEKRVQGAKKKRKEDEAWNGR